VFRGPFTRDAAERVAGAALPVLTRLVHKSLLRLGASEGAVGRYEMHELLRQYAAEQLDHVPDERAALEARHSEYYLAFVAARQRRLARNEPREASAEIRGEIDNVRQAWAWAAEQAVVEALERSTFALRQFYTLAGLALEGERSFRTAAECLLAQARSDQLAHARPGRDALLSMLLAAQAHFLESLGKYDQVIPAAQQAIAAGRASGEPAGETIGHLLVGHALFRQGHCADARPHIERALRLARSSQGRVRQQEALYEAEWQALVRLGVLDEDAGDYQAAKAYFAQALQLCQTLGKRHGVSTCLSNSGTIELFLGEYAAATANFQQALRLAREEGDRWGEGLAQLALGMVSIAEGQFVRASDALAAALAIFTASGDRLFEAYTLAYQGRLADSLSDYRGAREWLDRSLALSQEVGAWKAQFNACLFLALLLQHLGDEETAHHYAEQSQQIAVKAGGRSRQADALLALGHARAGLQKPAEALAAYQQALTLYDQLGRAHLAVEARAGLASLALAAGDLAAALRQVEAIWKALASHPHAGQDEPFSIYLVCYRVLEAVGDPRATTVVQTAQRLLREYADSIADAALRRSFLANVATHRALLEAAATAYTGAPQLS
jgi:tetratricopeptide (TPR) repeat protein